MSTLSIRALESNGRTRFALTDPEAFAESARKLVEIAERSFGSQEGGRLKSALEGGALAEDGQRQHEAVCDFLDLLSVVSRQTPGSDNLLYVQKSREFDDYLSAKASAVSANPRTAWRTEGVISSDGDILGIVAGELVSHVGSFSDPAIRYHNMMGYTASKVAEFLPKVISDLQQEANLSLIYPFFEKSLSVPGDACEFGCFRGILSVKLAWFLKAHGTDKHYYTFDTFQGFEIADPGGGALGVGAFRDDEFNAYKFLSQWSKVLPLTPVKGDATKTVATLAKPLSFVWLDLDMGVLMDPVLRHIWNLCSPETVIGIDDVGRPETPTVSPWLDALLAAGALEMVFNSDEVAPNTFIRFVRKKGSLPATIS